MASSESIGSAGDALDLVLDIGKSRSKLLVLDSRGQQVALAEHASTVQRGGAYDTLDTETLAAWLEDSIAALGPLRSQLAHAVVSAHGAAVAAVHDGRLAWPVPDYEFEGFEQRSAGWQQQIGSFQQTLSPDLPRGLNMATQLDWLERFCAADFGRGQLMPYAQYWAWWLSGVASSEVSSLGCHTHLWNPLARTYSRLAQRRGWSARFAPLRRAWDVLAPVRPALVARLGLPGTLQVHVGAHDSNACLARHLRHTPRMTLVSTGTWVVVMAPGATGHPMAPHLDLLGNVSVRQDLVPTGRFMGGREVQALCAGADPSWANPEDLQALLRRGVMAFPGYESQGGPFRALQGRIVDAQGPLDLASLRPSMRATLAACYTAQVTAWIVNRLGATGPLVLEGPVAHNPVYAGVLAALLPHVRVSCSTDDREGTALGAGQLAHWTRPAAGAPRTTAAQPLGGAALASLHASWLAGCLGQIKHAGPAEQAHVQPPESQTG